MTGIQFLVCLKYLLVALSMVGSAHALGRLIGRSRIGTPLLQFFFQTCLGVAVWSYLVFFLGLCHVLYQPALLTVFIGSIVLELAFIYRSARSFQFLRVWWPNSSASAAKFAGTAIDTTPAQHRTAGGEVIPTENAMAPYTNLQMRWADLLFVVLIVAFSVTFIFQALEPPHTWDDISYHLPYAKLYAESHAVVVAKFLRFPVLNQFAEMLFTAAFMMFDARSTHLIAWNAGILTVIGIYSFLREKFGPYTGLIGCTILYSSSVFGKMLTIAYVEAILCLYVTAFVIALLKALSTPDNQRVPLILAGIFAGCAIATKCIAIIFVIIALLIWLLIELIRTGDRRAKLSDAVYLFAPTIIVSAPWFIRNFLTSGNPVFPFFSNIFGLGELWNNEDLKLHWFILKKHCMVPVTLENIINLPWSLSFDCRLFNAPWASFARLCHFSLIVSPIAFLLKRDSALLLLLVAGQSYLLWWFFTCQEIRYALPALPALALAGAWSSRTIWEKLARYSFAKPLASVALLLIMGIGLGNAPAQFRTPITFPATTADELAFLRRRLPTYTAYEFLNRQEPGNVYGLRDDRLNFYYANGTFVGSDFGPGRWVDFLRCPSRKDMLAHLSKFKIKYLLINKEPRFVQLNFDSNSLKSLEGLRIIFEDKHARVYQLY